MKLRNIVYSFIICCFFNQVQAQESLIDLVYNPSLYSETVENVNSRNLERRPFIYLIDTIQLPFVDDFSKNKIKTYHAKESDPNIDVVVRFLFTVNGEHPEKLEFNRSPTYSSTKNGTNVTYIQNPELHIVYYDDGKPVGYDTGWTNVITKFDQGLGLITYDTNDADSVIFNQYDTLFFVQDDKSLWVTPSDEANRGGAYINNTYAINPVSLGVATFDGVDALGVPYDISSEKSHGSADTLESKPIYLNENMIDIYLSFFYQEGGNGNMPDEEDSLILEFWNVQDSVWEHIWAQGGKTLENDKWSEQVFIEVLGPKFQAPGFKFRFRNLATLSGNFDHWHLDYVRLDKNRSTLTDSIINDVSYITPLSSFTAPYTSVPYAHYLQGSLQADTVSAYVSNIGNADVNVLQIGFELRDNSNSLLFSMFGQDPKLEAFSIKKYNFLLDSEKVFPYNGEEAVEFSITSHFTISGNNDLFINDTVHSEQIFHKYYSYDDGSAEKAYSLSGAGLILAYQFNAEIEDTLRAINFNFPRTLSDKTENLEFEVLVWNDKESDPIYISEIPVKPIITNGNQFVRFNLEYPVVVKNKFHIGFRQINADKIYIGYDLNTKSNKNLYYKIGDTWYTSSVPGSLMMRPDFDKIDINLSAPQKVLRRLVTTVYPNPASDRLYFNSPESLVTLRIYDLNGELVINKTIDSKISMDVSHLPNGIYLIQMNTTDQKADVQKLVIAH